MTTPLVRAIIKIVAVQNVDPASVYWFDATGCIQDQTEKTQEPLLTHRPPFHRCMICWQGKSSNHQNMFAWMMVVGDNPNEGIVLAVWRYVEGNLPFPSPVLLYKIQDGIIRYRAGEDGETIDKNEAEMMLGFVSAWYESLSRRSEAYVPSVAQTYTNRRKIAQGKFPTYDWRTVIVEPTMPRQDAKGGTHASPRQHDRRGHIRRIKNGKNVWVKPCKVGNAKRGVIFHDYQIKNLTT